MIDGWELRKFGIEPLLEHLGREVVAIGVDRILILVGICSVILTGAATVWSLGRALRRSEERLTERLVQQMHQELLGRQEVQLARMAVAARSESPDHELELTERVDDGLEKQVGQEDESMEKLLASMRRLKNQEFELH